MESDFVKDVVLIVTVLMFVASAVAAAVKKVRLPYTVALVVTGALLAMAGRRAAEAGHIPAAVLDGVQLQPGVVLYVLLPLLLFEAAFNLDSRRLLKNLTPIVVLAVPAVIISTAIVGFALFLFGDVPHGQALVAALLFGAMVSTTDAVAVVAIFREIGAPKRLNVLVEGEALFNSGTALVLFLVIAQVLISPAGSLSPAALLLGGLKDFVVMALGGIAVGVAIGFFCSKLIGWVDEDPLIEITLSTICAPGAFLAGGYLGVSDVMAVIGAGLTLGNYGRTKISPSSLEPLSHYWHYLAFVANSIIFLLVGFSLRAGELMAHATVIPVAILAVLVARAVGIFPVVAAVNRFSSESQRIGGNFQTIMWWGGIRGALVLVMALTLSQFDEPVTQALQAGAADAQAVAAGLEQWASFKSWALHLAFGIVFFTILVNAPTTSSLIRLLGLGGFTPSERYEEKGSHLLAKRDVRERLVHLKQAGLLSPDVYALLVDRYMLLEGKLRKELADLRQQGDGFSAEDERRTLLAHCLGGEKAHLLELFYRGDAREDVMKDLSIALEDQLDRLRQGLDPDEEELAQLGASRLYQRLVRGLARRLGRTALGGRIRVRILDREYEAARARLSSIDEALEQVGRLERAEGAAQTSVDWIREFYTRQRETVQARLQSLADVFPSYAAVVQETLAQRTCLRREETTYRRLAARGRMSAKVLTAALKGLREEMAELRSGARPSTLIDPAELIRAISFFADLSAEEVEGLARTLRPIAFVENELVVSQGESGDRVYLIARGSVEILVRDGESDEPRVLDTLGEGNFFGEIALLTSSPRTASVRTQTACALLELRRRDLQRVSEDFPHVREALERAYVQRVLSTSLASVPAFAELDAEARAHLAGAFHLRRHDAGETFEHQGAVTERLWLVKRGKVTCNGSDGETRLLEEGQTWGEETVLFPRISEVDCRAQGPVELLVLRHVELQRCLDQDPDLRAQVAARVESLYERPLDQPSHS